jgi:hypothetical protein
MMRVVNAPHPDDIMGGSPEPPFFFVRLTWPAESSQDAMSSFNRFGILGPPGKTKWMNSRFGIVDRLQELAKARRIFDRPKSLESRTKQLHLIIGEQTYRYNTLGTLPVAAQSIERAELVGCAFRFANAPIHGASRCS